MTSNYYAADSPVRKRIRNSGKLCSSYPRRSDCVTMNTDESILYRRTYMGITNDGLSYWQAESEGLALFDITIGDLLVVHSLNTEHFDFEGKGRGPMGWLM